MKNLSVQDNKCTFDLHVSDISIANALRRALVSDVDSFCPAQVVFEENTTCQSDEYIAHRIGLVPFLNANMTEEMLIDDLDMIFDVQDRTLYANDLIGPMKSTHNLPIMKLVEGQSLKGTVKFSKNCGLVHARFCPVAAVGYELQEKRIAFSFESINGEHPISHLKNALQKLQNRLQNVKYQIESLP